MIKHCTKFERNRAIRDRVTSIEYLTLWPWTCITRCAMLWDSLLSVYEMWRFSDANTSCRALTLWPWALIRWPWKFVVDLVSHDHYLYSNFDRNRTIPDWVIGNLANFCTRYVTLWPWPLNPWSWPWTCMINQVSCDQSMYQIWPRSVNPRLSYW